MMETLDIKAMQADLLIEPEDSVRAIEPVTQSSRIQLLAQSVLDRHSDRTDSDTVDDELAAGSELFDEFDFGEAS